MKNKLIARACCALLLAECLLVILSWLLSATRLEGVRSLLSSEGVRWFVGTYSDMIASPLLAWLLLAMVSLGCLQTCGIFAAVKTFKSYRDRIALRVSLVFLFIYLGEICLLTLMPHAILLSVTGSLFPSAFSRSLVPIVTFGICLFSVSYGIMSGRTRSLTAILESLSYGVEKGAPLLVLYIFLMQFVASLRFVFG